MKYFQRDKSLFLVRQTSRKLVSWQTVRWLYSNELNQDHSKNIYTELMIIKKINLNIGIKNVFVDINLKCQTVLNRSCVIELHHILRINIL